MTKKNLFVFFEEFLRKNSIFSNKGALQTSFMPKKIIHRDREIGQIASILAPSLRQEKPSNLFVYGNTGTGKTLTVNHVTENISGVSKAKNIPLKTITINCKLKRVADTEYRLVAQLANYLGRQIPPIGLPTDEVYNIFYSAIEEEKCMILLVLDELDQLIKKTGDNLLYNLTRINEELKASKISIIGISNDATFTENIDNRVKSSLSGEDVYFQPYNALQMQDILRERASVSFKKNILGDGVIEKCAAYAAREHGDARKAIELLRISAEIAERNRCESVSIGHIDEAEEKLEKEKILYITKMQPKQFQAVLFSIISVKNQNLPAYTGEIYDFYKNICFKIGLRPLTQRRVADIIAEFELIGVINTKTISKGRYGRMKEITLSISSSVLPLTKKILEDEIALK